MRWRSASPNSALARGRRCWRSAAAVALAAAVAGFVGWLSFYPGSTPLYASVISLVVPIVRGADAVFRRHVHRLLQRAGRLRKFRSVARELVSPGRRSPVVAILVVASIASRSDAGRLLGAMRDNDERCTYLGIDTSLVRIGLT